MHTCFHKDSEKTFIQTNPKAVLKVDEKELF